MPSNANKSAHADNHFLFNENPVAVLDQQNEMHFDRNCYLTTETMADTMDIQPQSIRKRLSQTGSYYGLKPVKLPNRRLMWKAAAVSKFLRGED